MATYNISGTISGSLSGVVVTAGGKSGTSSGGSYSISAVPEGLVYIIPSLAGYTFSPAYYCLNLDGNKTGINFTASASASVLFSTFFHLRLKNSSGSVLGTFSPHPEIFARSVERGRGELVRLERTDVNLATDHWNLGWRQIVRATFSDVGQKYIRPLPGYSSLEALFNMMTAGAFFEYNIADSSPGGSSWVECELEKVDDKKLKDKNVGITLTIEVQSKAVISSAFPVS